MVLASSSVTSSRKSRRPFAQYRQRVFHATAMRRKLPEYTAASVRESEASATLMWLATSEVVNGSTPIVSRSSMFSVRIV